MNKINFTHTHTHMHAFPPHTAYITYGTPLTHGRRSTHSSSGMQLLQLHSLSVSTTTF